jgi:hypothetical protein
MNLSDFIASLSQDSPPASLSLQLSSLWFDGKGDWKTAHDLINDENDKDSAWVHAYLHRKEGDHGNAGYWYRRAGKEHSQLPLEDEWIEIGKFFVSRTTA